jgi:hypothetical protein
MMIRRLCAVALLVAAAGCGGGKTDTKTTTTVTATTAPVAAPTAATAGSAMNGNPATGGVNTGTGGPPGFTTETAAQGHCAGDTVVWLNTKTKVYHEKGMLYYGHTKQGAYVCKKEADAAGDHETKNGK